MSPPSRNSQKYLCFLSPPRIDWRSALIYIAKNESALSVLYSSSAYMDVAYAFVNRQMIGPLGGRRWFPCDVPSSVSSDGDVSIKNIYLRNRTAPAGTCGEGVVGIVQNQSKTSKINSPRCKLSRQFIITLNDTKRLVTTSHQKRDRETRAQPPCRTSYTYNQLVPRK